MYVCVCVCVCVAQAHARWDRPSQSDDWVRNFAVLVRDTLRSDVSIYIEYSNEVWSQVTKPYAFAAQQVLPPTVCACACVCVCEYVCLCVCVSVC